MKEKQRREKGAKWTMTLSTTTHGPSKGREKAEKGKIYTKEAEGKAESTCAHTHIQTLSYAQCRIFIYPTSKWEGGRGGRGMGWDKWGTCRIPHAYEYVVVGRKGLEIHRVVM